MSISNVVNLHTLFRILLQVAKCTWYWTTANVDYMGCKYQCPTHVLTARLSVTQLVKGHLQSSVDWYIFNRHPDQYSVYTLFILDQQLVDSQSSVNQLVWIIKNLVNSQADVNALSIKYWSRVDRGYWWRASIDNQAWMPLVHTIQWFLEGIHCTHVA